MGLETIDCEDCGTIILMWSGQDPLCHNCKQKRLKKENKAVKATRQGGGLDQWI